MKKKILSISSGRHRDTGISDCKRIRWYNLHYRKSSVGLLKSLNWFMSVWVLSCICILLGQINLSPKTCSWRLNLAEDFFLNGSKQWNQLGSNLWNPSKIKAREEPKTDLRIYCNIFKYIAVDVPKLIPSSLEAVTAKTFPYGYHVELDLYPTFLSELQIARRGGPHLATSSFSNSAQLQWKWKSNLWPMFAIMTFAGL